MGTFESLPDVRPQLYADNLNCSAQCPDALFGAARFTAWYVRAVGQDVSPGKCVLLSTSKSVRKVTKLWGISGEGRFWNVQLDVRDVGGHFDFTNRARAGTLSRLLGLLWWVPCPWSFRSSWDWFVESTFLLVCMLVRPLMCLPPLLVPLGLLLFGTVWSSKVPLANAPAVLNLLDGPVGVDPALHIIWVRFRMMRRAERKGFRVCTVCKLQGLYTTTFLFPPEGQR